MGLNEDMERVALQERELRFRAWISTWRGTWVRLRSLAEERSLDVVIDVRRFGQPLFYTALEAQLLTTWSGFAARAMLWPVSSQFVCVDETEAEERDARRTARTCRSGLRHPWRIVSSYG